MHNALCKHFRIMFVFLISADFKFYGIIVLVFFQFWNPNHLYFSFPYPLFGCNEYLFNL